MANEQRRGSATPWVLWVLTLMLCLAGAWLAFGRVEQASTQRDVALKSADDATAKVKTAEDDASKLKAENDALKKARDDFAARAEALSETLEQKEAELAKLTQTYKALEDKMQDEIKRGDIALTQKNGRIQVDLVDKILFDSGQADLNAKGEAVLTKLGAVLATISDKQIQVSGHTDDAPITKPELLAKFASNWELSTARAVNVVRYLAEKANVPPGKLVAAGYGQHHPRATNATPKGRAANRRIEVLLLPSLEAKAAATAGK